VFAIKNLPGMVGAVMARYSRAETGLRETLLREFVKADQLRLSKADKLIERVLIAYGDDSVGELEGAHLSFEDISMVATKVIEHRRIGGSPIEQSTRYIRYDFRDENGNFRYFVPEQTLNESDQAHYRSEMDAIFESYKEMFDILFPHLKSVKPLEEATYDLGDRGSTYAEMADDKARKVFTRTYDNDIKTKTCDVLRAFLPLATLANVGLFGNGRYFQHLISKLITSDLPEANDLGHMAKTELDKVIPHYVKRSKVYEYLQQNEAQMKALVAKHFAEVPCESAEEVTAIQSDFDFIASLLEQASAKGIAMSQALAEAQRLESDISLATAMVYPYTSAKFETLRQAIIAGGDNLLTEIFATYYGDRKTRRDRPERALEHGYPYTFELITEWAVYKDLMRHRMGTLQYQPLKPNLGFEMPPEIKAAGLSEQATALVARADALHAWLEENYPALSEYAVLHGHKMRWLLGMNDRALMHMLELRTAPQGHPHYRRTCQLLHKAAEDLYPERAKQMSFVNHDPIYWSRSDSEARQRVKEDQLEGSAEA
jgi:thymidylate synthase ThyX